MDFDPSCWLSSSKDGCRKITVITSYARNTERGCKETQCLFVCLCVVVFVYLSLRYLTLIISTDEILRMTAQFFISISLCWLFWAAM